LVTIWKFDVYAKSICLVKLSDIDFSEFNHINKVDTVIVTIEDRLLDYYFYKESSLDVDINQIVLEDKGFIYKNYYSDLIYLLREFECLYV